MNWIEHLGCYIRALQQANFPPNAICSHHGVYVIRPRLKNVGIAIVPGSGGLQFMLYGSGDIGFQARTFNRWRAGVATHGKIITEWNGHPGNNGISIVTDISNPEKFVESIANYRRMPSPFKLRPEDTKGFNDFKLSWFAALLKHGVRV